MGFVGCLGLFFINCIDTREKGRDGTAQLDLLTETLSVIQKTWKSCWISGKPYWKASVHTKSKLDKNIHQVTVLLHVPHHPDGTHPECQQFISTSSFQQTLLMH